MSEPSPEISTPYQRQRVAELIALVTHRQQRATDIEAEYRSRRELYEQAFTKRRQQMELDHETGFSTLQGDYLERLEDARTRFEADQKRWQEERDQQIEAAEAAYQRSRKQGEANWEQTRALALHHDEKDRQHAQDAQERSQAALASCQQQYTWIEQLTRKMFRRRGLGWVQADVPPSDPDMSVTQLLTQYGTCAQRTHDLLRQVSARPVTRFVDDGWPILLFLFLWAAIAVLLGRVTQWAGWQWPVWSAGAAAVSALLARQVGEGLIRRRSSRELQEAATAFAAARTALLHAEEMVSVETRRRERQLDKRKRRQLRQANDTWQTIATDLKSERDAAVAAAERQFQQQLQAVQRTWDVEAAACREKYVPRIERSQADHNRELATIEDEYQQQLSHLEDSRSQQWAELIDEWQRGTRAFARDVTVMNGYCQEQFPTWSELLEETHVLPQAELRALPWGHYRLDLAAVPHGIPEEPPLQIDWQSLPLPAVLAFPSAPSFLAVAEDEGRVPAIQTIQTCMLRLLTALPPGKVRFTIFDPTGLGENFSTFMHLADFDERLVSNRIWTEAGHMQQRLADLTEYMENVIQKYLRNEFASIQEYNRRAGEIAEPFQILVVANFPANFSEEAARRLVSIATSGARCGVYFLISVDRRLKLPSNFHLADLEGAANTLVWNGSQFAWKYDELSACSLTLDAPPPPEVAGAIVKRVGQLAMDANRVEVPFASVVPADAAWWQADSAQKIEVPLGRAGATQLQSLTLGVGTSQHVLIAGKTGSGKSTLLNALITNLSLHYSPAQLQFFLIDFKKGVEFKAYAERNLPHAQVIAIESEREFGMSVLERLDAELQHRGDVFRDAGVQNLAAFRDACPDQVMPRLLLIIDEFQEFFVKDDKIAHDAGLFLDRLVRQGRAFGIHVLLGSQTLSGAYSLARSTLGQMAVRIALQCSESDAHLILSEENTAARLLNRPGEAIYNNANGRFEGNHPFQVVWLPDAEREEYLSRLSAFAAAQHVPSHAIVFEGNVAAELRENEVLLAAWKCPPSDQTKVRTRAWLGAPVAIKEPTCVQFRRQGGSHLVIVGPQEPLALGVMLSAMIGLAACHPWRSQSNGDTPQRAARFFLGDGGIADGMETALRARMDQWPAIDTQVVSPEQVGEAVSRLGEELSQRLADIDGAREAEPIFLVLFNLPRFRELRMSDDDFGLGSFSDGPSASPSQTLTQILRDGPTVGIHCLIWCDSYNNLNRWFSRQSMRDISFRVVFQMSAGDSSNLIDTAAASHLGAYRAILYNDERGEYERFRPYSADVEEARALLDSVV